MFALKRVFTEPKQAAPWILLFASLPFMGLPTAWLSGVLLAALSLLHPWSRVGGCWIAALLPGVVAGVMLQPEWVWLSLPQWGMLALMLAFLRWRPSWGLALELMVAVGLLVVGLLHLLHPHLQAFWLQRLTWVTEPLLQQAGQDRALTLSIIHWVANMATGLQVTFASVFAMVKIILARQWLRRLGCLESALWGTLDASQIRLSLTLLGMISLVLLLGWGWHGSFAVDATPVVMWPLAIAGVSVCYHVLPEDPWGRLLLTVAGLMLVVLWWPYGLGIIIVVGLLDSPLDLRACVKRWKQRMVHGE